jgi:DNA-binding CsgD family transcriptional regulator
LIGIGARGALPFNVMTGIDPAIMKAFADIHGADPQVNPRVKAGMEAPVLRVLAESDFISHDEHARHPHYQSFAIPYDIPYICLTPLERRNDMLIGLAVVRSQKQGHVTDKQREVFGAVAPHVRAAVRTQIALEGHGAALLAGAMEAISVPLFVCDAAGNVEAFTPAAEALIAGCTGLQLKSGQLQAARPADATALSEAFDAAIHSHGKPGQPPVQTVVIRCTEQQDSLPIVLDVMPLRASHRPFSFTSRLLVIARSARARSERTSAILQAAYALTSAEADIALQLSAGKSVESIATCREVTVGTVRAQIKTLLAKVGVNRQVELVARLNQL